MTSLLISRTFAPSSTGVVYMKSKFFFFSATRNSNKWSVRVRNRDVFLRTCNSTLALLYSTQERNVCSIARQMHRGRIILQGLWMYNIILNIIKDRLSPCPCRKLSSKLWRATALKWDSSGYRCITWIRGAVTWTKSRPWGQVTWLHHDLWDWLTAPLTRCPLV